MLETTTRPAPGVSEGALRQAFLDEASEVLLGLDNQLVELEARPHDRDVLDAVFRGFHSIKGGATFLPAPPLVEVCHAAEELLQAARAQTIVLDATGVDDLLHALDAMRAMLEAAGDGRPMREAPAGLLSALRGAVPRGADAGVSSGMDDEEFEALLDELYGEHGAPGCTQPVEHTRAEDRDDTIRVPTAQVVAIADASSVVALAFGELANSAVGVPRPVLERLTVAHEKLTVLLSAVAALRVQPVGWLFVRFIRTTRDLARSLGKSVELQQHGTEIELDRSVAGRLADPLGHLLRNAIDHGIELPLERIRAKKPRQGLVVLTAEADAAWLTIRVRDDGRGMDPEQMRAKAIALRIVDAAPAAKLDTAGCLDLAFHSGFTTSRAASEISGRGVGLDAVREVARSLGGDATIASEAGVGTCVSLRVPLRAHAPEEKD